MRDKTKVLNLRIDKDVYDGLDSFCSTCLMTKRKAAGKATTDFVKKIKALQKR